ncbi:MAG: transcriptional regulator [Bacteroidetes bacterium HGW-Bacteroidetes-5]|jgi:predicted DNA-binding transcriptional regulator YafY|nr:MAG: transcriptional regulator [Bacteroidetes bacterium HGW-Bacteroidetes-5]
MDQPKLERLLRIMQLMTDQKRRYSIEELSQILEISIRSIYRYIDTFESVGFIVRRFQGKIWLARESKQFRTIAELVYFTEEEAYILKRTIESLDASNPAVNGIKRKLYSLYDFGKVADIVVNEMRSKVVNTILDAIANEKQVILNSYSSSHSANVSDRLVEPVQFGVNMVDVLCYEISSDSCKTFKVPRIGEVLLTESSWQFAHKHKRILTDSFRFSGLESFPVKLKLTMVASNLLKEEFPLCEDKISKISDNEYLFEDSVCSFEGVGRFVLGLCNEIEILESKDFIDFLNKKRMGSRF